MKLKIKFFVEEGGKAPQRGKIGDAGMDVFAYLLNGPITVKQGEMAKIPLGFRYSFWEGYEYVTSTSAWPVWQTSIRWDSCSSNNYWFDVRNRSGIGIRSGFTELASVCDAGYRGVAHYCVAKVTPGEFTVNHNDKIAQILITPFVDPHKVEIEIVSSIEDLGSTDRGDAGFGSTNNT